MDLSRLTGAETAVDLDPLAGTCARLAGLAAPDDVTVAGLDLELAMLEGGAIVGRADRGRVVR